KTIDNDIFGVAQTFGFDTAVHEAARLLTAIKLDATTSGTWFLVEIMGRYTGHLALEAGLAAGVTRVLIPEEGAINVEDLVELVAARQRINANWGVVLLAESTHFGQGYITRFGRLGGVAEKLAERLDEAVRAREMEASIRFSNLGYFLRSAEPTGFDKSYAAQLGTSAARFLLDPVYSGKMVTIEHDQAVGVPIHAVAGKLKPVDLTGVRYQALKAIERYEAARGELLPEGEVVAGVQKALAWLAQHCNAEMVAQTAMRLGISPPGLLRALEEMSEVATGEAERRGHTAS
ncbi:MAG: 6-phosphofructokinase, partial [Armatimonadetes bacterium]|nr:6-phosphofructokinase [Armatimonadota bacterium]